MPPEWHENIILTRPIWSKGVQLSWPLNISQGSAATYLRWGDSSYSTSLRIFFSEFNSDKYENWSTSNKALPLGTWVSGNYD